MNDHVHTSDIARGRRSLWIDDDRPTPPGFTHTARSSAEAIAVLAGDPFDLISFDHDLGGDDTAQPVVRWMLANGVRADAYLVHSANPVGCDWLDEAIAKDLSADPSCTAPVGSSFGVVER